MAGNELGGGELTVAVMGLGEAGSVIAADLAARGHVVHGYDPAAGKEPRGVLQVPTPADAVRGADAVLVVVPAEDTGEVARSVRHALVPGTVYADCCTAGPDIKRAVATVVEDAGAVFADVALLAPVPGHGLATPMLVSGGGGEHFAKLLHPLGLVAEVVSATPGDAAARKLLRSVFMKGMAAALLEAVDAADALGAGEWLRGNVAAELERADAALVERLITGSKTHAARRVEEMADAQRLLTGLSVGTDITEATRARLERLAAAGRHGRLESGVKVRKVGAE